MRWSRLIVVGLIAALVVAPSFAQDCPTFVGFADTPWCCAYGVAVSGNYAYVANGRHGLRVIDVSTPSSPAEVGSLDTPGIAFGVAVSGGYAYVAAGYVSGLWVIDVSTPSSPIEVGFFETLGIARGVAVSGSHAFVTVTKEGLLQVEDSTGLLVIDVSDPSSPIEVGYYDIPEVAGSVTMTGRYAYVTEWARMDIFDPSGCPGFLPQLPAPRRPTGRLTP